MVILEMVISSLSTVDRPKGDEHADSERHS